MLWAQLTTHLCVPTCFSAYFVDFLGTSRLVFSRIALIVINYLMCMLGGGHPSSRHSKHEPLVAHSTPSSSLTRTLAGKLPNLAGSPAPTRVLAAHEG